MSHLWVMLLALAVSGCASILGQSSWPVYVDSLHDECDFVVKNKFGLQVTSATTPKLLHLESGIGFFQKADYTLAFTLTDKRVLDVPVYAHLNRWYFGNILNVVGFFLVDPATGAMWRLPERVTVDCSR